MTGSWLSASSKKLKEPGVKFGTPRYKVSGLSTIPWELLYNKVCYKGTILYLKI